MSIIANSAKFTIVPTSDGNNQIIKYSDDYINKVLNGMKVKHAKEVETSYWCGKVLTPEEAEERINQVRESIIQKRNIALDEFEKKYNDAMNQNDETICLEHRQKVADSLLMKRQALINSYNESIDEEIELIKSDLKKEKQFLQTLNEKKTALKQYKVSSQIVIDDMKAFIKKHKQFLQQSLGEIFKICFEEKINSEFPCDAADEEKEIKHKAKIQKVIDYAYKLSNYKQIMNKFVSYSDYMEKSLLCWLPIITKIDITENKHLKVLKDEILALQNDLSHYICELVEQIISSADNPTYVAANMKKDFVEYVINETYEQFTQKLVPQIDNYYNELYSRKTRRVLSALFKRYHVDLGDGVKKYFEKDYNDDEEEDIDWKARFDEMGLILQSIIQTKHEHHEEEEKVQALPQPQIVEEVEEVVISKPVEQTKPAEKSFEGFVQTLPNDEIRGEDLVKAYNEYFGTNTTSKSLCQKKEFKNNFTKSPNQHIENRKRVIYYIKQ